MDVNAGSGAGTHLTSMVHRLHRFEISSERAGNCPHRCRLVRRDRRAEIDNRAALTRVPGADDDSGEAWRSQQDTDAQLSDAEASARRNRADLVDRLEVTLESGAGVILVRAPGIVGRERLVASPRAEQHAAEERRVRDGADVVGRTPRKDIVPDGRPKDAEGRLVGVERHAGRPLLL